MVGAVLVQNGKIIGEGYTSAYGGPHAEVNAIKSVAKTSLLPSATLYVTLEPCSHFGKTPPCADVIIKHKIPKVVIGIQDPHDKVAGKGIKKLTKAGIEVHVGVLKKNCEEHHQRFLTYQTKNRPYIILKWAESADGYLAPDTSKRHLRPEPYWITNAYSRQLVHQWRSQEQAILVGTNTVIKDNPSLTARDWKGKSPIRIILDRQLRLKPHQRIFKPDAPTIVVHDIQNTPLGFNGIDYEALDFNNDPIPQLCTMMHRRQITSVIVEGGAKTLQSFIDNNLWDEARIFKNDVVFKTGLKAPVRLGKVISKVQVLNDTLTILKND